MQNKSAMATVLILGGIGCILAAFGAVTYLYHEHAAQFAERADVEYFVFFVGIPSLLAFVVGIVLVVVGIGTGSGDRTP
jgi:hypothetical protein